MDTDVNLPYDVQVVAVGLPADIAKVVREKLPSNALLSRLGIDKKVKLMQAPNLLLYEPAGNIEDHLQKSNKEYLFKQYSGITVVIYSPESIGRTDIVSKSIKDAIDLILRKPYDESITLK